METDSPVLEVSLLGAPTIVGRDGPIRLESTKALALLAFLALQPGPVSRPRLMALLWPDSDESRAAANLRHTLWNLRRRLELPGGAELVVADRAAVRFLPGPGCRVDVHAFLELCARVDPLDAVPRAGLAPLLAAASLYRGELLEGLLVDDAPELEEWLLAERERLRLRAVAALDRLVELTRPHDLATAVRLAQQAARLDPWREEAHRTLAELLAASGQPVAALRQLEACRLLRAEELQAELTAATLELAERIRRGELRAAAGPAPGAVSTAAVAAAIPLPSSPVVGRARELERLASLLADPTCRLLTVLGPGGVGKTRLGLEAARRAAATGAFPDGVVVVPLADLDSPRLVVTAMASALRVAFADSPDPATQLVARLGPSQALLVLDGFEHVMASADLVGTILAGCPGVKLLVTSRERLCLREEWLLDLGGLEVGSADGSERPGEAAQLFVQTARRVVLGYAPDSVERAAIARICAAVDGLPLAIELAGPLVRTMPASALAREVERDLDVLESALRDLPPHHSSLRALFDHTWRRLTTEEARALAALAVCAAGFDREAALAVARTRPATVAALVDRSALHRTPDGRYRVHEVLRQYAIEKLGQDPEDRGAARDRHARHFLARLAALTPALRSAADPQAADAVQDNLDNLRLAWRHAVERGLTADLEAAAEALALDHERRCCFADGVALLGDAVAALEQRPAVRGGPLVALLRTLHGGLLVRLGRLDEADESLAGALELAGGDELAGVRALVLFHHGEIATLRGRYDDARRLLAESLDRGAPHRRARRQPPRPGRDRAGGARRGPAPARGEPRGGPRLRAPARPDLRPDPARLRRSLRGRPGRGPPPLRRGAGPRRRDR